MDHHRFTSLRSGACALVLLAAAGSPAIANPCREAAFKALEFEIRQCVLHGIMRTDPKADTTEMLEGPFPEEQLAHLARAWPLATAGSGRLLSLPPFGRRMFLMENKDLLEKRDAPYLCQLYRYVGLLLGKAKTQPVNYLLAAELPAQAEEYEAVAQALGKALGLDPACYREVMPSAMAGLRDLAQEGARNLEHWLDLFLDGYLASGRPTLPAIKALLEWREALGGQAADRNHFEALLPLLKAAAETPEIWDRPASWAGPLGRRVSDPRDLRAGIDGTPAKSSPEAGASNRRPSAPGSQGRPTAQTPAEESKSTATSMVKPRIALGGSAAAPGTPLPARALAFYPGAGGPRSSSRAGQERVESKASGTATGAAAAVELSPSGKSGQSLKGRFLGLFSPLGARTGSAPKAGAGAGGAVAGALSQACLAIVSARQDAILVLEGGRPGLVLQEVGADNVARDLPLAGQPVPLTRGHSYLLRCPGAKDLQLPFQILEGEGADAISTGLAWSFRSGASAVIPHEGKQLPAHFQVQGGSLVIFPRESA